MTLKGAIQSGQRRGRLVFTIRRKVWPAPRAVRISDNVPIPEDAATLLPANLGTVDLTANDWELVR